jgi:hypothetical protein
VTRRTTLALLVLAAVLAIPAGAGAAATPAPAKSQATAAFKRLVRDTRLLPRKAITKKNKVRLVRLAQQAKRTSLRQPCKTVKTLKQYRRHLKAIHEPGVRTFEPVSTTIRGTLEADALTANVTLLQLPNSRRCGGGRRPSVTQIAPKLLESDEHHLRLRVSLPSPTFAPQMVGGTVYEQMFMDGMGEGGAVGQPGLPELTHFYGVPQGADIKVTVNGAQGYDLQGVNLFPHQAASMDLPPLPSGAPNPGTFENPPFQKNPKAYRSNSKFPASPTDASGLGDMRGLTIGGVDLAGGQYRPKSDTLHVFTSLDVTVEFGGANKGTFGDGRDVGSNWSTAFARNYALLDNNAAIAGHLTAGVRRSFCGEEMLVVTSPALQSAANTFAAAKTAQGYFARVVLVGSGAGQIGTTNTQIQSFIRGELTADCNVRPQYVVLLGNTDAVPTFTLPCTPTSDPAQCNVATDLPYSLDGVGSDLFADVELGRIPATDPANADAVVSKIVNYENTMPAPAGDDFYKHATVTGYFQPQQVCVLNSGQSGTPNCNPDVGTVNGHLQIVYSNHRDTRGFTKTSDTVLQAMRAQSYTVDRLWTTDNSRVTPEQYYDGTDIPSSLRRPAFAWNAGTPDFLNAYNAGRFLIFHRDHGWIDGWAAPTLSSANIPDLNNGTKLPVVFGINCASAQFDIPGNPSFVEEQIEKPSGGAVAGFGDTRVSPSFPNNHMALGFFDALFPNVVPGFGSPTATRRLGDVLLSGKAYMASQDGLDGQSSGDTYFEHQLYHLLGDPSMQMWAATPVQFDPARIDSTFRAIPHPNPGDPAFEVEVKFPQGGGQPGASGTVATLFHGDQPIGRSLVGADGTATIIPEANTDTRNLTVRFQQDGVLPAQDTVDQGTPAQPTTLTLAAPAAVHFGQSNTFTGHLDPAFAGAPVKVVYTADSNGEQITQSTTTDANGDYKTGITFSRQQQGSWKAQAFYDGDVDHGASSSNVVQFKVGV